MSGEFNKRQYNIDYVKSNIRQFMVKVSRVHEPEMIEWLESKDSIQSYIRELIRADMEKQKEEQNNE